MDPDEALDRALTRQLYRFACPEPHVLGELHLGVLEEGREQVEAHVRNCPRCQEELAALERFLRTRDQPDLRVLVAQWVPQLQVAEPAPAYAVRGTVQLASATYQAGEFTLSVSITEDPQNPSLRTVAGIVSGEAEPGGQARARLVGPTYHEEEAVDTVGQFAFDRVPAGRYTLEVELEDALVQVSPLEVA
ncbi:MAG: hypothetical protein RMM30_02390 [Armatimonadota bacterium]|nr:hypothetical protein [Armatimonadota bacterium]MDW8155421.1 hypothetical protein [Armatimonadota bacterium]